MRGLVLHVRRTEQVATCQKFIDPAIEQRFEIEQVPDVFLNRPGIAVTTDEHVGQNALNQVFNSRRCAAKTLHNVRPDFDRIVESEGPLDPGQSRRHSSYFLTRSYVIS